MKKAHELYGNDRVGWLYDYQPILNEFGVIALQVDDNDYQGDSRVLYNEGGKIGYLQFGWGSCSGCDALQACQSWEEVDKLIDELRQDIQWFDTKEDALEFFTDHDWEGDYSWNSKEQAEFVKQAIEYLSK